MIHRTANNLSLDEDQKKSLLLHDIWHVDDLDEDTIDEISNELGISKLILPNSSIPCRKETIDEYRCGIDSIDNQISLFLGGVLTELCGLPGSGRTTLCFRYAKEILPGTTLWIDTEGCLYPPKGLQLSVIHIHDYLQMFALTHKIASIVESLNPSLIVVDSIAATMRGEASMDLGRTSLLWELAIALKKIASEKGIAVILTNHLSKIQFSSYISTLGPSWQNACTHCFEVKNVSGGRVLRILKSPCLPRVDLSMTYNEEEFL